MVESITPRPETGSRLAFLDFVRGIAAFSVLLQHGAERLWPSYARFSATKFDMGRFGVLIFFLVSGFIIPFSLERGGSVKQFWRGRVFRLYPLYWTSLALMLLFSTVRADVLTDAFRAHETVNALANVTMVQELVGRPHAIGLYYTLTLELVFYGSCSVLFVIGLLKRSWLNAWMAVAGAITLGILVPLALQRRTPMAAIFYLMSMFVGTVLYRFTVGGATRRQVTRLVASVFVVGIVGVYVNYVRYYKPDPNDHFTFWAAFLPWVAAYAFFLVVLAARRTEFPRPFQWLGRISYSLYLMHPLVLFAVDRWHHPWLSMAVLIVATLLLSDLTFRFVERPFHELGRRRRPAPVPAL